MNYCSTCKKHQDDANFSLKNMETGKFSSKCKECQNNYSKQWYQDNKESVKARTAKNNLKRRREVTQMKVDYWLEHPCVDCGEADPIVLEFDHVRGEKKNCISSMSLGSDKAIKAEIAKCVVRCANCHKRKTAKEFNWYDGVRLTKELGGAQCEDRTRSIPHYK